MYHTALFGAGLTRRLVNAFRLPPTYSQTSQTKPYLILIIGFICLLGASGEASAQLTVTPVTWNVLGLDSNNPAVGPNIYPVGVRVCNTSGAAITNVTGTFVWTTSNIYVALQAGSTNNIGTLNAGSCGDIYFTVVITRNSAAHNTTRGYRIDVAGTSTSTFSTPTPRELYVEKLVSQNRNSVSSVTGPTSVILGGTYNYVLNGSTATNGYEQLESFLSFPASIFQVVAISTTYTAPSGGTNDKYYADACGWDNVPSSPTYRDCIGPAQYSGGKVGGTVVTTYTVKIVGTGAASLAALLYDFSGSSYHYNSDFGALSVSATASSYSVGNRIWLDNGAGGGTSNNGIRDGSEAGIANVSVSLFVDADANGVPDNTSSPVATVTTDSSGYYRFDNVAIGGYVIRVNPSSFGSGQPLLNLLSSTGTVVNSGSNTTDNRDNGVDNGSPATNGILSSTFNLSTKTIPTTETDNQTPGTYGSGSFSGTESTNALTDLTIDFGFRTSAPSLVELREFQAVSDGTRTLLQWRSGLEHNNLGYNVYRVAGKGQPVQLNAEILAGSLFQVGSVKLTAGHSYAWLDDFAQPGTQYFLEDIDAHGRRTWHGPIVATVTAKLPKQAKPLAQRLSQINQRNQAATAQSHLLRPSVTTTADARLVADSEAWQQQQRLAAQSNVMRLGVAQSGWYRITGAQLEAAGFDLSNAAANLQLYADGVEQALLISNQRSTLQPDDALEFYGVATDNRESGTRTYWLVSGNRPGLRIAPAGRVAPNASANDPETPSSGAGAISVPTSFPATVEIKERNFYIPAPGNGEAQDNFYGFVVTATPLTQTFTLEQLDPSANAPAVIVLNLQGIYDESHHRVTVKLNGQTLGVMDWPGIATHTGRFEVPQSMLTEGANTLTLQGSGGNDISLVASARMTYARRYTAESGTQLWCSTSKNQSRLTLSGFAQPDVRVFDITNPARPAALATRRMNDAGGYAVAANTGGNRQLLAITPAAFLTPSFITRHTPAAFLNREQQAADFLIIAPAAWRNAVQPLADARQAQGLNTSIISLEDIYAAWSGGETSVAALRGFLKWTHTTWRTAPRYVLLVGDASFDPRNYLGLGGHDIMPTGWRNTPYLETMSDESLVDFDGDGVGEMSLGRWPVRTVAQVTALTAKTLAYQPDPRRGALLVSDRADDGGNFAGLNQNIRPQLPPEMPVQELHRDSQPDAALRQTILTTLNNGPAVVQYSGHGSQDAWTDASLLQSSDAAQLTNADYSSVYVMVTCLNGYFADEYGDSLGEALLRAPRGGAVAIWAATGMTINPAQTDANAEWYRQVYENGARLGDAARAAKAATTDPEIRAIWILFGDPTLRLAH